jgi:hypothetical protein
VTREVECPACGAIIVGTDDDDLVTRAREHTVDAHGYLVPRDHVLERTVPGPAPETRE